MNTGKNIDLNEDAIIQIRNVYKSFGTIEAVNNVSLDVHRGEVVVIIGPSGSGKSTLLRCINHLENIDKGSVVVDGIPLSSKANINKVRAEVGMVFQQFNLFPHLSVLENVMISQRVVRKRSFAEAERIALDLLEKVGIPDKAANIPGSYQVDNSSVSRLPAPWRCSPKSCCSMSRPRRWIPR